MIDLKLNNQSYWDYLTFRYIPGEQTSYNNILKFDRGTIYRIKKNSINKKYPNAQKGDVNKNGITDVWFLDENKNGKIDAAVIDANEDGIIETVAFDENENKNFEIFLFDDDLDGNADRAEIDEDDNGTSDIMAYDINQDGEWDKYEKIS